APPPPSSEAIREHLSRLSDAEVGALIRGRLGAGPEADRRLGYDLTSATGAVDHFRSRVAALLRAARDLPALPGIVAAKFAEGDPERPLGILGLLLLMAAAGWSAEWLGQRAFRDVSRRLRESWATGPLAEAMRTLLLLILGGVRVALFGLGAL